MQNAPEINFFEPELIKSPFAFYDEALERNPIIRLPNSDMYVVFSAPLVTEMLQKPAIFSSNAGELFAGRQANDPEIRAVTEQGHPFVETLVTADPPGHTHYRKLVNMAFSKPRVDAIAQKIREFAVGLIDGFIDKGKCEFVREFSMPLPIWVIASQIGLSEVDPALVKRWSDAVADRFGGLIDRDRELECAHHINEFQKVMLEQIESRRSDPKDDLLNDLVYASVEGENRLSDTELLSVLQQLMVGGNETTTHTLGMGMVLLLQNPDVIGWIKEDASRIPRMVEEILRLTSTAQAVWRIVKTDTVLGGVELPAGSQVMARLGAANRDGTAFPEPNRFDPARKEAHRHFAFGRGIHFCVGNMLARTELAIAFEELFNRLDRIEMVDQNGPDYFVNVIIRGFSELPLKFERAA